MNGEIAGVELVVQEVLEFLAKLVQGAMDLAPIEVESELVGRDQNPESPAVGNAVEVAVPLFLWTNCSCNAGCPNVFSGGSFDWRAALPTDGEVGSVPLLRGDDVSPEPFPHDEQSAMAIETTAQAITSRRVQASLIHKG